MRDSICTAETDVQLQIFLAPWSSDILGTPQGGLALSEAC